MVAALTRTRLESRPMNLGLHGLDLTWWELDGYDAPPWESIRNLHRVPVFGRPGERIFAVRDAGPVYERAVVVDASTPDEPIDARDRLRPFRSDVLRDDAPTEMAPRVLHRRLYERRLMRSGRAVYAFYVDRHAHLDNACVLCANVLPQVALYVTGQRGQVFVE